VHGDVARAAGQPSGGCGCAAAATIGPAQLTIIGWVSEHSKSGKPLLSLVADDAAAAGDEVEDGAAPGTAADAPADVG
jgi:hypothetical protein